MKKRSLFTFFTSIALILALAVGAMALAESTDETATGTTTDETAAIETETDDTALKDALTAYAEAKKAARLKKLEDELNQLVADGQITQEQADLILDYYTQPRSAAPSHSMSRSRTGKSSDHATSHNGGGKSGTAGKGNHSRTDSGKTL